MAYGISILPKSVLKVLSEQEKKKKKSDLTLSQEFLTSPFVSKVIDFVSAGQTLPEAEQYSKEQIENIKNLPKVIPALNPFTPVEKQEQALQYMKTPLETIMRPATAIQRALPPLLQGKISEIPREAAQGLFHPEMTPAGYLGGEARKLFPTEPEQYQGKLFTPSNITAALLGTIGDIASIEAGLGNLPGRIAKTVKKANIKGAFKSGEELVDKITKSVAERQLAKSKGGANIGKTLESVIQELRPKIRKAVLGSKKAEEILNPKVAEALIKKQPSEWLNRAKKALLTEAGQKPIISPKDVENALKELPTLTSTDEAIAYGSKATPAILEALKKAKLNQDKITKSIQAISNPTDEQLQQGMNEAVKGQFLREAIESAEAQDMSSKIMPKEPQETPETIKSLPSSILPTKSVKSAVRAITGQKDISEPIVTTEKQALKRELAQEQKASRAGFYQGKQFGVEEEKARVRDVLAGKKARKEVSDETKRLISSIKSKPTTNLPIEYKDAIEEIKSNVDFDKVRLSNILKREKANALLDEDAQQAAKELSAINAEDMTLSDLREVEDIVSQLYHSGSHENKYINNEIKIKHDEAVMEADSQIKSIEKKKTDLPLEKILNEETAASRAKRVSKQYLYENRRPEAIFHELDNFKDGGVFKKVVWNPAIEGTYKYQDNLDKFVNDVKGIAEEIKGKNVGERKITVPGLKRKITVSDAMSVYAHSQNPANTAHLKAMGFDDAMIDSVIKQLDPKFKNVVDKVIDYLTKEVFPVVDKANVALKGNHLAQVNRYFPILNLMDLGSVEAVKTDLNARQQYKRSGLAKSFTKERAVKDFSTKAFRKLDFFSTLYQHLNNVAYWVNMSGPIRDASKFLFDPNVKALIREKYGDSLNKINRKWIDDISTNRLPASTNIFETIADTIGKNAVMYFIGNSLSVAMKQPASFLQGAGWIGPANAMNGLLQVTTNPMAVLKFASNRSSLINHRVKLFSQERDFQEIFSGKGAAGRFGVKDADLGKIVGKLNQLAKEGSMIPVQIMDMTTVLAIWKGSYDASIAKNVGFEEAVKAADEAIRRTQPMSGIINLPESFRGNVLMRQITRLKNQPSQNINLMIDAVKKFSRSKKEAKDFAQFGKNAFWWFLGPAILWGTLSRKRLPREGKEVAQDLLNFGLGGLPFLGQALSAYVTPYYDSDMLNSFLGKIKGGQMARTKEKRLKSNIEAAGIAAGVPGGGAIARAFFGEDLRQKVLGGPSLSSRLKEDYMFALRQEDKQKRIDMIKKIKEKAKKSGLSSAKISKDAKTWLRNDIKKKYGIEGSITDSKNLKILRKMKKKERNILIKTYSSGTQEDILLML